MAGPSGPSVRVFAGELVDFVDGEAPGAVVARHRPRGALAVADGRIVDVDDDAGALRRRLAGRGIAFDEADVGDGLLMPGFVDVHVHAVQTDVIASWGTQLLDWLERHTFPAERRFEDPAHAAEVAEVFVGELLRNGTTGALVFGTVHPGSVDAVLGAAHRRGMRMIAGKSMMDRHCPEFLRDTAQSSYDDTAALIRRWHGTGRLGVAVTPRFAPTSTDAQLEAARALLDAHPGTWLQTHVAENHAEVRWVAELYPHARSYLDVYERFGLLRPRSVYAHCIHLDATDRRRMAECGAAAAFCPTSNLFLGSGLYDVDAMDAAGVVTGLATDVGGGTSFSMLRTMGEAYKVAQMAGQTLAPSRLFHLATLGSARALGLDDTLGRLEPGYDADFVVLDPHAVPLLERRIGRTRSLEDRLFVYATLGDDRAVASTWVHGACAWRRPT